jgi:RNA polymerase sigma factor for flagellar operon FliA
MQESELLARYDHVVRHVVLGIFRTVRQRVEYEDLMQSGRLALVQAWRRYDADSSVPFEAWAIIRVRGQLIDQLRDVTGASRSAVRVLRRLKHLQQVLEAEQQGNDPVDVATISPMEARLRVGHIVESLFAVQELSDATDDVYDSAVDAGMGGLPARPLPPDEILWRFQRREMVTELMEELPEMERWLLEQHYFHERALAELAEEARISRSWASRLHCAALRRLHRAIMARDPLYDTRQQGNEVRRNSDSPYDR